MTNLGLLSIAWLRSYERAHKTREPVCGLPRSLAWWLFLKNLADVCGPLDSAGT
jgi:hypothetical protein